MTTRNLNLRKKLAVTAVVLAALGGGSQAMAAAEYFTYDFDGIAGGSTAYANGMSATSSESLQAISATQFSGVGWVQFTSLNSGSSSISGTAYSDTGLYAIFSLTNTLLSGTFGAPLSLYTLNSLDITLMRDVNGDNGFVQGDAVANITANVNNTSDDQNLGTATLLPGTGVAALLTSGAASLNAEASVAMTPTGLTYFISPTPFYDLAFAGFNATGGSYSFDAASGRLSIGNAIGAVDFHNSVPEPASLALVGLGLLGFAASRRRR